MELDQLPVIDEHGEAFLADPFAVTRAAREQHWIARCNLGLMTLTHADAQAILRDERFIQPHLPMLAQMGVVDGIIHEVNATSLVSQDGASHHRLRRLVNKAFTPKRLEDLRPLMREVVTGRLDALAGRDTCEFVGDIAELYPLRIICSMLGIPEADQHLFVEFLDAQIKVLEWDIERHRPMIEAAMTEMKAYITRLIEDRRSHPTDDLLSDMLQIEDAGERMTLDEVIWMVDTLLVGGLDTTRCQLGHAMVLLAERRDDWRRLATNPNVAAPAVEEILRFQPSVMAQPKIATVDVAHRDVVIPAGTAVFVSMAAANRDPAVFPDPDTFDIVRMPNPHLAFGFGPHHCIGAALARFELREALPILARRLPNFEIAGPVEWRSLVGITGPDRLPLRFDTLS